MGWKLRVDLGNNITYGDMERLSSSSCSYSTLGGGEGEGSKGVDRWIMTTGVDTRIPPIPVLDHPNVLSYKDVLRRDANVGDMSAIIGAGRIGFDVSKLLLNQ